MMIEGVDVVQFPEDMLIEILINLPVKSLMRFKCVSKYWCALIKSPNFLTRHVKRDCKKILLVKRYLPPEDSNVIDAFKPGGDDILSFHDPDFPEFLVSPSLTVPFLDDVGCRYQVILMGPCIGLVCVMFYKIIVLCNPALREFKLLEPSPFDCPEDYGDINYGSGFGFDANSNSYKIILMWKVYHLHYHSDDEYVTAELYNSSTDSWNIIDVEVPQVCYNPGFDLLFNGACHWEADKYIEGPPAMGIILSFDLGTELFHQFEFPNWFDDDKYPGLVALNQCLALVRYSRWMEEPYLIDIWMMKEYGNKDSWIKELVIGPYLFTSSLLCWGNEWLVVESIDNQLAYCALHENQLKKFQFNGFDGSFRALMYKESIIRLDQAKINFGGRKD